MKSASKAKSSSMASIVERLTKDSEARKQAQASRRQFTKGQTKTMAELRQTLSAKESSRTGPSQADEQPAHMLEAVAH